MPFDKDKLRKARKDAGLNRERLAIDADCGYQTIVNYELGKTTPAADLLERIADRLGVEVLIRRFVEATHKSFCPTREAHLLSMRTTPSRNIPKHSPTGRAVT